MNETISQTELYEYATQYACKYGGFKTTAELKSIQIVAGRLSGSGDKSMAIRQIEAEVDKMFGAGAGVI